MFHFPAFPPHTLCIQMRVTRHHSCRVSPFGHPRINARLAAPRGLSQPPTSFIGSQCQGIHHAPLNTYNDNFCTKKLCTNQFGKIAHQTTTAHPLERKCPIAFRCSQPLSTNQTPHPTTKDGATTRSPNPTIRDCGLVVSKPNSVLAIPTGTHPRGRHVCRAPEPTPLQRRPIQRIAQKPAPPRSAGQS